MATSDGTRLWEVPDGGEGTHTLAVALSVPDDHLTGAHDDEIVSEIARLARQTLTDTRAKKIITQLATELGTTLEELRSHGPTTRQITHLRHETMLQLREAGWTYQRIGWLLNRDHSTIIYGCQQAHHRRNGTKHDPHRPDDLGKKPPTTGRLA